MGSFKKLTVLLAGLLTGPHVAIAEDSVNATPACPDTKIQAELQALKNAMPSFPKEYMGGGWGGNFKKANRCYSVNHLLQLFLIDRVKPCCVQVELFATNPNGLTSGLVGGSHTYVVFMGPKYVPDTKPLLPQAAYILGTADAWGGTIGPVPAKWFKTGTGSDNNLHDVYRVYGQYPGVTKPVYSCSGQGVRASVSASAIEQENANAHDVVSNAMNACQTRLTANRQAYAACKSLGKNPTDKDVTDAAAYFKKIYTPDFTSYATRVDCTHYLKSALSGDEVAVCTCEETFECQTAPKPPTLGASKREKGTFDAAVEMCARLGQRLPTIDEIQSAYKANPLDFNHIAWGSCVWTSTKNTVDPKYDRKVFSFLKNEAGADVSQEEVATGSSAVCFTQCVN